MTRHLKELVAVAAALGALYGAACILGFALVLVAFQIGLLRNIEILFYRGLLLIAGATIATLGILVLTLRKVRWQRIGPRDAFAATVLSLALNLAFLIVVPVTVDRSISIFILDRMAAHPDTAFTPASMQALFTRDYLDAHRQIERRLTEQEISGNIRRTADGYEITPHGQLVIAASRVVAKLFDSRSGLLTPEPVSAQARR